MQTDGDETIIHLFCDVCGGSDPNSLLLWSNGNRKTNFRSVGKLNSLFCV